ncbi:MAG: hypothetical protein V1882_09530 [Candidatus Omnitrophota bacterium]
MQKIALNTAGIVFLVAAEIHLVRWVMRVPLIVGETAISPEMSAIGAVIVLLLALWMLIVARRTGPVSQTKIVSKGKTAIKFED